ncbi:hypothetical protein HHI36_006353 [Cryptolaemus montrouzieri]|uniref:Uncharacterized protein n=1 Tax=Cryptolaemus montrouzieri TaxID=559131 RepID=A0ABD2NWX4_9CUCU
MKCTGFVVNKRTKDEVKDFEPVDERICEIRVKANPHNLSIISKTRRKISKLFYQRKEQNENALDTVALKPPNIINMYKIKVKNKLASLENEEDNAHSCEKLKPVIKDASKETLSTIEQEKSRDRSDEQCKSINERKNRAYRQLVQKHYTRIAEEEYR